MAQPKIHPDQRDLADVVPTDAYAPHDRVWVYHGDGLWRAGIVYDVSSHAVTVICDSPTAARGTEVEFRTARYVARRDRIELSIDTLSYV